MANDKYYGYSPKKATVEPNEGAPGSGNRLDRVNPYEFRKGMDYELTKLGVLSLRESTPEEREKCTETVLKNLNEHGGYYSGLIQFEGGMNHGSKITETNFKKWLETYMPGLPGTGMLEANKEIKTDKMTALKEAIKKEVDSFLSEGRKKKGESEDNFDKEPTKKQVKGLDKKVSNLDNEREKLEAEKKKLQAEIKPLVQAFNNKEIKPKGSKSAVEVYKDKIGDRPQRIKDIIARLGEIEKEKEAALEEIKAERYSVAETVMTREVHRKLLEIIKSKGVNLREGAEGVRVYYEIAKIAYMEGLTAGLTD